MPQSLALREFLQFPGPILDVRSPGEFLQGHIPGSQSFALFSNEERAQIGTIYKKHSRQEAVELGLLLIEPKLKHLLNTASLLLASHGKVLCWRGGMRSGFVARLFELMGYSISTLQGGYKTFRRWTLQRLENVVFPHLCVLSGLTGSGKTSILQALKHRGEQVIDLEEIAHHRGSAFGGIGMPPQPSQEQFENELARVLEQLDPSKRIWIEDESRLIGRCHLPLALYRSLIQAPLFYIHCPLDERLSTLLTQYGKAPEDQLLKAVNRIAKRLGSQLTKEIKQLIENRQNKQAFERLLAYYDKTYQHQIAKRPMKYCIEQPPFSSADEWALACLCSSKRDR